MDNESNIFWKKQIKLISWFKKPKQILTKKNGKFVWFDDGKSNVAFNCLQKNISEGNGSKTALIIINEKKQITKISFQQLSNLVDHFIKYLSNFKINKNKTIIIHAKASLTSVLSMLACAKLGITHSVIFEELPKEAIIKRLEILKPEMIISGSKKEKFLKDINTLSKFYKKKILIINFSEDCSQEISNKNLNYSDILKKKYIFEYSL